MAKLRLGIGLLGIAAVLGLSVPVYERFFGRSRLRFPYLSGKLSAEAYSELASKPGWSAARLEVAPQVALRGLLRRPRSTSAPWVLFYPGNDSAQLRTGQAFLSRLAADQDWGLGVFAYRGYDSSDGSPRLADLARDAPVILDRFCSAQQISPKQLHVVGFSIGGHFATHAVGSASRAQRPPASLLLFASVDDIVMVEKSWWWKLDPGDDYQTRPLLPAVAAPVLVLQGTNDEALNGPAQGRAIAATLGNRAQYAELPGVGHEALLSDDAALGRARQFIAQHSSLP